MAQLMRAWLMLLAATLWFPQAQAGQSASESLPSIAVAELPVEARDTLRIIKQGGPFAYQRDGAVFKNYERILPKRARGYYREYTVKTPGARNRGARRIVCGPLPEGNPGKVHAATLAETSECYYTADHYQTFKSIRE